MNAQRYAVLAGITQFLHPNEFYLGEPLSLSVCKTNRHGAAHSALLRSCLTRARSDRSRIPGFDGRN